MDKKNSLVILFFQPTCILLHKFIILNKVSQYININKQYINNNDDDNNKNSNTKFLYYTL